MPGALTILLATDVFPPKCGGSGWSTYHLARALRERGHRTLVARPREGLRGSRLADYDGLPVHELGLGARGGDLPLVRGVLRQERFWPRFARFLADLAWREGADLIHGQHLISIPAAVAAGRIADLPAVATVRDYWPTCPIGTRLRRCPDLAQCSSACQVCCLARGQAALRPLVRAALPYVRANLRRRQEALLRADRTIAVSNHVAAVLRAGIPGLEPVMLPNFIDVGAAPPRPPMLGGASGGASGGEAAFLAEWSGEVAAPSPLAEAPPSIGGRGGGIVLYVGKLEAHKGADLLPQAMAAVPGARLIIAGTGPLEATIARECAQLGVDAEMRGEVPNAAVLRLMAGADALLFPARWEEPLTRTLLEAGSMGLPAVALATGGNADIIRDGETGVLVARPADLGPALAALLADPERRARLGEAARAHIAAHFSEAVVVPRVEALYRDLVARRGRHGRA